MADIRRTLHSARSISSQNGQFTGVIYTKSCREQESASQPAWFSYIKKQYPLSAFASRAVPYWYDTISTRTEAGKNRCPDIRSWIIVMVERACIAITRYISFTPWMKRQLIKADQGMHIHQCMSKEKSYEFPGTGTIRFLDASLDHLEFRVAHNVEACFLHSACDGRCWLALSVELCRSPVHVREEFIRVPRDRKRLSLPLWAMEDSDDSVDHLKFKFACILGGPLEGPCFQLRLAGHLLALTHCLWWQGRLEQPLVSAERSW